MDMQQDILSNWQLKSLIEHAAQNFYALNTVSVFFSFICKYITIILKFVMCFCCSVPKFN
jgi:hypothetical protein